MNHICKNILFLILLYTLFAQNISAQILNCDRKNKDSSSCYISKKFIKPKIVLDKKWESIEIASTDRVPLLADMDGDCIPEFITFGAASNYLSRPGLVDTHRIHIINSLDGSLKKKFDISCYSGNNSTPILVDINNDGIKEIIFSCASGFYFGYLLCYDYNGILRWVSNEVYNNSSYDPGGPSLGVADFNQDGIPEVYVNNRIFNARTGILLAEGGINGMGSNLTVNALTHQVSVAGQLDDNLNDLELAAGYTVYKIKIINKNGLVGNSMTPLNIQVDGRYLDGKTALADINNDGQLDVIVSYGDYNTNSRLYTYTLINGIPTILTENSILGTDNVNGCPLISDIDGNGIPNILVSKTNKIHNFEFDGSAVLKLVWSFTVADSVSYTGISAFDLNGDGKLEIIYRGDSLLYVIDSNPIAPRIIDSKICYAFTLHENPVVADIDNTGSSKICTICGLEGTFRIRGHLTVFGSPDTLPPWAPARGIWNQYAYNPLFINDDLTVPQFQKNQATYKNGKYNNFMQQESYVDSNGMVKKAAASLSGKISCINYDVKSMTYSVIFDVYNRKDASLDADTNLIISFYSGDPNTNGIYIGSYHTDQLLLAGDSLLNLVYRFQFNDLKDLFMVVNTKRTGNGTFGDPDFIQLECDYTDNISRSIDIPVIEPIQANICKGDQYNFFNTVLTDSGTYEHKIYKYNGCDSVITILQLSTVDTIRIIQSVSSCDSYLWNGRKYTLSGRYSHDTISVNGCDSSTTLNLSIHLSDQKNIIQSACDSLVWNGMRLDQSGSYQDRRINLKGCDSITTLELAIHKSDSIVLHVNSCNSYSWNGKNYLQSGIYTLDTINQFGCDSLVKLNLNLNSIINKNILQTACDSYNWNGRNITQSGIYMDTTISSKGCDSITRLQLIINKSVSSNTVITSCDSYTWNGIKYTQTGSYSFTTQNSNGCDSIANLQLTIHKSSNFITNISRCNSYSWNNMTYTQSGSYPYQTVNANGCDSIATLNLTINKADSILMKQTACNSYNWNNKTYTQSGKYVFQTTNINACDSIVMLDLTINSSTTKDTSRTICDSLNFLGKTLKTSGHYSFTIPNSQGCDSIIHLSLNISSQHYKDSVSNCGSYVWPINGRSYDSSGIYVEKYSNVAGCDSIYLLNLIVNKNYEIKEQAEVCKEYLWPVNKQVYTHSGLYRYPFKSSQGCDSILSLDLRINPEFKQIDTVITTSDYLWPVNKQIYPSSGSYEEDYTSSQGCDSIHLLLLTINKEVSIYYPNVIHPGGINEWFTIFVYGNSASIKVLSIYDRWGSQVWQKESFPPNELQQGWNGLFKGQKALPGVYVWKAVIELQDGSVLTEKGDVTLLR